MGLNLPPPPWMSDEEAVRMLERRRRTLRIQWLIVVGGTVAALIGFLIFLGVH